MRPFPHCTARNVFVPRVYAAFEAAFLPLLQDRHQYLAKHDTHGTTLTRDVRGPLKFFASRPWHDLLAALFGIPATGHVNIGLHHHEPRSASGFPHNDVNPGWFVDYPSEDGIVMAQPELCSYTSGQPLERGVVPRETVRAAVLIFYLANPPWRPGDGGETGLYEAASDDPERPCASVPPVNNSLLAFECQPYSFHGFMSNRRAVRNSLVMWLHREKADAVRRWGHDAIVPYR